MGIETAELVDVMQTFKGLERRLERVDDGGGIAVIDDYAHNPEKIRAAWAAVALSHRRVAAVWRPHGYGPLAAMQNELASAISAICRPEDRFFALPVFYAGGTAEKSLTSEQWVERLKAGHLPARAVTGYAELEDELARFAKRGDAILIMGARDPDLTEFAKKLARTLNPPALIDNYFPRFDFFRQLGYLHLQTKESSSRNTIVNTFTSRLKDTVYLPGYRFQRRG
jgi:UDP-N-acetylmuramate--alanine ligase